jgi:hypothetical protein
MINPHYWLHYWRARLALADYHQSTVSRRQLETTRGFASETGLIDKRVVRPQ